MSKQESRAVKPRLIQDIQTPAPAAHSNKVRRGEGFWRLGHRVGILVRRKMPLVIGAVLVFLGGVLFIYSVSRDRVPPIPTHFKQLGVPLYHPEKLPKDVVFKPPETSTEKDGIITKFTDTAAKGDLFLTQQKRPAADLKQIDTQETYLTSIGTVYFLKGEKDRLQAIIETDQTWILLDGPSSFGIARAKEIILSLKVEQ